MTEHPITPTPELLEQLESEVELYKISLSQAIARAYTAGADQELEACCEWLETYVQHWAEWSADFCAARRPKPPSLKEQAKFAAAVLRSPDETCSIAELQQHWHTICNALEQLND